MLLLMLSSLSPCGKGKSKKEKKVQVTRKITHAKTKPNKSYKFFWTLEKKKTVSLLPAWLHSLLLPRHKHIFSYWFDVYFQRRDFFFKLCSNSTLFPHSFQSEKSEWDPNFQTGNLRQDCRALVVEKQCGRFLFGIEGDVKINLCELIRVYGNNDTKLS